ncbi:hypothetical protein J8273_6584 [Carpediemonas membranifera]|uniref:Uncharacterized protein n=1 Tax=Carpediemonas membranifera TaxID=201153 RepID=A0A8J6AT80_9EUKA|nr:hypothetical protein J8273_6584 [Carpediemonas membranifera]|eukprot:KAG9391805.1 hypothetical protein J8273_6584 [Carpediemonas membranifera]
MPWMIPSPRISPTPWRNSPRFLATTAADAESFRGYARQCRSIILRGGLEGESNIALANAFLANSNAPPAHQLAIRRASAAGFFRPAKGYDLQTAESIRAETARGLPDDGTGIRQAIMEGLPCDSRHILSRLIRTGAAFIVSPLLAKTPTTWTKVTITGEHLPGIPDRLIPALVSGSSVAWAELIPNEQRTRTQASVPSLKSLLRELPRAARPSTRTTKAEILRALGRHFFSASGTSTVDSDGSDQDIDEDLAPTPARNMVTDALTVAFDGVLPTWATPGVIACLGSDAPPLQAAYRNTATALGRMSEDISTAVKDQAGLTRARQAAEMARLIESAAHPERRPAREAATSNASGTHLLGQYNARRTDTPTEAQDRALAQIRQFVQLGRLKAYVSRGGTSRRNRRSRNRAIRSAVQTVVDGGQPPLSSGPFSDESQQQRAIRMCDELDRTGKAYRSLSQSGDLPDSDVVHAELSRLHPLTAADCPADLADLTPPNGVTPTASIVATGADVHRAIMAANRE